MAFSGGKDSQCVYHLCQLAGVKFDPHYSVTTVDPPELVQFIKQYYPDAWAGREHGRYKDGTVATMWNLIPRKQMPPTRLARYCCEKLKETHGKHRITVTGVRWAESWTRQNHQGVVTMPRTGIKAKRKIDSLNADYTINETKKHVGIVMNDDNDVTRRAVEICYRTNKTIVNPIIDWDDDDTWGFIKALEIPYCSLYDEGCQRIGCIGCPMGGGTTATQRVRKMAKVQRTISQSLRQDAQEAG